MYIYERRCLIVMKKLQLLIATGLLVSMMSISTNLVASAATENTISKVEAKATQSFKGVVLGDSAGNLYVYDAKTYLLLSGAQDEFTKSLKLKYVATNVDTYYEPRVFLMYKALNNGNYGETFANLEADNKNEAITPSTVTIVDGKPVIKDDATEDFDVEAID